MVDCLGHVISPRFRTRTAVQIRSPLAVTIDLAEVDLALTGPRVAVHLLRSSGADANCGLSQTDSRPAFHNLIDYSRAPRGGTLAFGGSDGLSKEEHHAKTNARQERSGGFRVRAWMHGTELWLWPSG